MRPERRQTDRIHTDLVATLKTSADDVGSSSIPTNVESISSRGICVSSSAMLPEADSLEVTIPMPGTADVVTTKIERVWEAGQPAIGYRYGFLFTHLTLYDFRLIEQLIHNSDRAARDLGRRKKERRKRSPTVRVSTQRSSLRRLSIPTFPLYIGGHDVDTGHYDYFPYIHKAISNPVELSEILFRLKKGEIPAETPDYICARACLGGEEENLHALQAAHEAFGHFRNFSLAKRIRILRTAYSLLVRNKHEFIDLLIAEGHPRKLAEWEFSGMEQGLSPTTTNFYKKEFSKRTLMDGPERTMLIRKPDGVVCVSPPRNASASNSLNAVLAFLGGNTLVVKPPRTSPVATMFLWRNIIDQALRQNGAPAGTLNIVIGNTLRYINQWIASPLVSDIMYFGDSEKGIDLGNRIYAAGKKPILELSGKDILAVWPGCDLKAAAVSLSDAFLASTQICMVPKMAVVHERVFDAFMSALLEELKGIKIGLPNDDSTSMLPVSKIQGFFDFLEDAMQKGAKLITGGNRKNYKGELDSNGIFLDPTIVVLDSDMDLLRFRCVQEENFFPLLPIVRVRGGRSAKDVDGVAFSRMTEIINANPYGLRVSVW